MKDEGKKKKMKDEEEGEEDEDIRQAGLNVAESGWICGRRIEGEEEEEKEGEKIKLLFDNLTYAWIDWNVTMRKQFFSIKLF